MTEILRQLTHKEKMWEWIDVKEEAFQRLREKIANMLILKFYNQEELMRCAAARYIEQCILARERYERH